MKLNGYVSKEEKISGIKNTLDEELEKYIQRADILYGNMDNNEEITIIKINPNVYKDRTSSLKNLKQKRKDKVKEIKENQRNINNKQLSPKDRTDYINKEKSNINNSLSFKQNTNNPENIMKSKKRETVKKNYKEIANLFYPDMEDKSEITIIKRKPINNEEYEKSKEIENEKVSDIVNIAKTLFPNGLLGEMPLELLEDETKNNEKDYEKIADLFYPEMKSKVIDSFTGGASDIKDNSEKQGNLSDNDVLEILRSMANTESDKNFFDILEFILAIEKGYNNFSWDLPTNFGVTQPIYNFYRKEIGKPVQSVKNITLQEAIKIYYKYFWIPSGAYQYDYPTAFLMFDTAVNSSPKIAKKIYNKVGNDIDKFIEERKKYYNEVIKNKPQKRNAYNGWMDRLEKQKRHLIEKGYYSESDITE